jgi:hypothetical protein
MTPILCARCLDRGRERPADNLAAIREYPGAVVPMCRHCEAGQEDPRVAE